ncbi:CPBP family intramembrane glutamic endopeptidase [Deinococcus cellulosilyticus]|uniref:CAAX prenyl protease 2/Lysostaphin resistance protein A-like domain-containing protein n=1 Tax=Deinococcus cellulosilyticus (strain DSM 18568 / NBRC 106333 / KACC 11606 / 5516J-15) TaxID=1223518 RepID=A0A511MZP3_DEIC1|nr:CPBP family intramembrane glutamic endopeptidase [Deinococcus cellulosilyticus]GEM45657.1 hypothetical protein DC3_12920 [Deinococcus cellulosilyticus NBRC 106333 = KACC 11606]
MTRLPYRLVLPFVWVSFLMSWLLWLPKLIHQAQGQPDPYPYLHFVGSLGPAVGALLVCALMDRGRFRQLLGDLWQVKVPVRWWLLALSPLLMMLVAMLLSPSSQWSQFLRVNEYPGLPFALLLVCEVFFYGYGEEVGWRGFLYPLFKERFTPFWASMAVLPFWAVWHLPLLLTSATYQSMGPLLFGWLISLTTGALLTSWMYDRTHRSLPVLAVFHGVLDVAMVNAGVTPLSLNLMGAATTLLGIWAGVALWKDRRSAPKSQKN